MHKTKNKEQKMLSVKDAIIEEVASKIQVAPEDVDKVVMHQFKDMIRAMHSGCNSVEMSGFGVFHYLPAKATRYKLSIERDIEKIKSGKLHINTFKTLEGLTSDLEMIKNHFTDNAEESKTNS